MNIYLTIDESWSYRFLTKHKQIVANYDFFTFNDRFLTTAINFAMANVNFKFTKDSVDYHTATAQVSRMVEQYPLLGTYIPKVMYEFYHTHIDAFMALPGPIVNYQPIIDDNQLLVGLVLAVDNRTHLNAILQS